MTIPASNLQVNFNPHRDGWRQSIMHQLHIRKSIEQTQFEDIYSFAGNMFDRVDIYKSENIQLNLKCENLQQQLLGIQQTLLAGGSAAAKTVLSKLSNVCINDQLSDNTAGSTNAENLTIQHASLLSEKSLLEKKVLDLQETITDLLKNKSDTVQKVVDLKTELEDKDKLNKQLALNLETKEIELRELKETLEKLDNQYKKLEDEHISLTCLHRSLEKKNHLLSIDCDVLRGQVLAAKGEDADRLNAENERILALQRERQRLQLEANVAEMTNAQLARQAAGDPAALALEAMRTDNFDLLDDDETLLRGPSWIPKGVAFAFDAHEGESYAVNWYFCSSPKDSYLATGANDRKVKIWKIGEESSTLIATLLGSNASITSIDVESDNILASCNDFATRIWSINGYKPRQTLTGHSNKVTSAKFINFKRQVATGSHDRTVKIWDVRQGACLKTYFAGSSCFDLVCNDSQLMTCHFDTKIRCWDLNRFDNNESIAQIVLQSKITSLDISNDGTKLLCSVRDNTIKVLDIRKMEVMQTYSDEKFKINQDYVRAKFSIDGQYISCGSNDGSLYIWNTNSAKVEKILNGHTNPLLACCWSPDGERMASVEKGRKVVIWTRNQSD